jgi:hypothetical protein
MLAVAVDVAGNEAEVSQCTGRRVVAVEAAKEHDQVWEVHYADCKSQAVACMHIRWLEADLVANHAELLGKRFYVQRSLTRVGIPFAAAVYVVFVHGKGYH